MKILFSILFFLNFINSNASANCSVEGISKADESGFVDVKKDNGDKYKMYWVRFNSSKNPTNKTIFYLAGGPLPHYFYINIAKAFQRFVFQDYNFVLYDYLGVNCSSSVQTLEIIKRHPEHFTMEAMAKDFFQLKNELVGNQKVTLIGGSHGSMLGGEIINKFPDAIEKAILFSGDLQSGWLQNGWFNFDELLKKISNKSKSFANEFKELINRAENNKLIISYKGTQKIITREEFEVSIFFISAQSSQAQQEIEIVIHDTFIGKFEWLENAYSIYEGVLKPVSIEATPTTENAVINFHRCNVWFPKSMRTINKKNKLSSALNYESLINYWNKLCVDYDSIGEFSYNAIPQNPTSVPIFYWIGDQDYFAPEEVKTRLSMLTTNLTFHVKEGWSHDFGTNPSEGFNEIISLISKWDK